MEDLYFWFKILIKMCIEHSFKQEHTQKHTQYDSKSIRKIMKQKHWARKYLDISYNSVIPLAYTYKKWFPYLLLWSINN